MPSNQDSIGQARADVEIATRQFIRSLLDIKIEDNPNLTLELYSLIGNPLARARLQSLIPPDFQGNGMSLADAETQLGKALFWRDSFQSELTVAERLEAQTRLALIGVLPEPLIEQHRWDHFAAHSRVAALLIDSARGVENPHWLRIELHEFQRYQGLRKIDGIDDFVLHTTTNWLDAQFALDPLEELHKLHQGKLIDPELEGLAVTTENDFPFNQQLSHRPEIIFGETQRGRTSSIIPNNLLDVYPAESPSREAHALSPRSQVVDAALAQQSTIYDWQSSITIAESDEVQPPDLSGGMSL